ncbi:MAG: DegT/DnrJ/EryC1/StrS family aminotransferase [Myxococcota bacterium]|nr:DegT/DnrJ/EryC1/StrS family aminotransferase [Myxococcota bacterium]
MSIPLVDLRAIHGPIEDQLLAAMQRVVSNESYILGPEVEAFEKEVAAFLNVGHAVGVSSGTDALLAALMALDVGRGDEVVTTPYTFFATAGAIARVGAQPVFCDINAQSFNMDPELLERSITSRTKAIIVVHLFGRTADMDAIGAIAERHGLPVIEDAAQAIGSEWEGRRAGGIGRVGCFSFFPAKNLGCLGDGGLVTTGDSALADRLRRIRKHGGERRYLHREVGGNFRLDALQAAVLRVKLPYLEGWTSDRQDNAMRYGELLSGAGLSGTSVIPPDPGPGRHVWNQYVLRVTDGRRSDAFDALRDAGIGCAVYYPVPLHLQPCFADLPRPAAGLPVSEKAAEEALALPIAPGLSLTQQEQVVATLKGVLG